MRNFKYIDSRIIGALDNTEIDVDVSRHVCIIDSASSLGDSEEHSAPVHSVPITDTEKENLTLKQMYAIERLKVDVLRVALAELLDIWKLIAQRGCNQTLRNRQDKEHIPSS